MDETSPGGEAVCYQHLVVDGHVVDPVATRDVARFRRAERARLYQVRRSMPSARRISSARALMDALVEHLGELEGLQISAYWPIRGEPDLRPWMQRSHAHGARLLLPVVEQMGAPLVFRRWEPKTRMVRGTWNIPVPDNDRRAIPDVVIVPLLGVDEACYRLGNGGGYYDRTLVRLHPRPHVVGVGFAACALPTIFPMPWDVPMDMVLLDDGTMRVGTAG